MASQFYNNSVFWIEVDKIKPNPHQPRKEFDEGQLRGLADSIRQYGVLQALVVTRQEIPKEDGGLAVEYELVAGERRLRASKLAGLSQVPVLIRVAEDSDLMKLELAIIENIQREDLNAVDRARAFARLAEEFKFKHHQIADKVGKSREYVSNSLRILSLPEVIIQGLVEGKITEGHTRPLLMLIDRPAEQDTLFKEIMTKQLTVREAEAIARRIALDRIRRKDIDPLTQAIEQELSSTFGTRVHILRGDNGGKISIEFFSEDELSGILNVIQKEKSEKIKSLEQARDAEKNPAEGDAIDPTLLDDRSKEEKEENDEELYSIRNFSI